MKSAKPGAATSAVEVTNISEHGFWILLGEEELYLPFDRFPWFRDAPVAKIGDVELVSSDHLYRGTSKPSPSYEIFFSPRYTSDDEPDSVP